MNVDGSIQSPEEHKLKDGQHAAILNLSARLKELSFAYKMIDLQSRINIRHHTLPQPPLIKTILTTEGFDHQS